jgi:hypothetical protein
MHIERLLAELREAREKLEQSLLALENLSDDENGRGGPPSDSSRISNLSPPRKT